MDIKIEKTILKLEAEYDKKSKTFDLSEADILLSTKLQNIISYCKERDNKDNKQATQYSVKISGFNLKTVELVVEYLHYRDGVHYPITFPNLFAHLREVASAWDNQFIKNLDNEQFYQVLLLAKYLEINSLVDLCKVTIDIITKNLSKLELFSVTGMKSYKSPLFLKDEEEELKQLLPGLFV